MVVVLVKLWFCVLHLDYTLWSVYLGVSRIMLLGLVRVVVVWMVLVTVLARMALTMTWGILGVRCLSVLVTMLWLMLSSMVLCSPFLQLCIRLLKAAFPVRLLVT